ncbi:AAA family ATPase [Vibrio alginolyticus]|uniref:ATP-dependent nuclease n=1 Tax=Vibrio alginolyticus TaxID=663 RepID=UPI00215C4DA7|nr:ATP-dependent endonuclease [Vibrio alginolyticus]ELB2736831.1 AAA family ATPase [Vibrio alginolyticus]ELB2763867.1 AAA family ATPase [Vibrio alginolyticus]MCR9521131.1 ATP-dependent endonuclease [Vibrio alginolyticus]MCS0169348.1 ATP-dependent endonuclease [Vibrio alginolyticus]
MSVKLEKLIIKNFRSIGIQPVTIDLDDIVILVGGNNFGKSTILKAYAVAVNSEKLEKEDFHNNITDDPNNRPTIELHTICSGEDRPGQHFRDALNEELGDDSPVRVKEKFVWEKIKEAPKRIGYRVDLGRYPESSDSAPHQPWATDNASRKKRPKAHLVGTFDNPDNQSDSIKSILVDVLLEQKIREFEPIDDTSNFSTLYDQINSLKTKFLSATKAELDDIADDISEYASRIVPEHKLKIHLSDDDVSESNLKIFDSKDVEVNFGKGAQMFPVSNHGSGARRTLLWAVLKKIAELGYEPQEKGKKYKALGNIKSHLLLLDEPELSLHPNACRETRDMLYDIAENNDNWQIMLTTHSPSFIDLTRDHTKIIRVENSGDKIVATTIFKPDDIEFTEDESESLKLLNLLNPDVMEFFFGGKVLLVEGDTEYCAFGKIINDAKLSGNDNFDDLLILRCGGKVQVSMFMKILNHFKKQYYVLHDIDSMQILKNRWMNQENGSKQKVVRVEANPAWTNNSKIHAEMSEFSNVYASVINFETAYFGTGIDSGKPENALNMLRDPDIYQVVQNLLTAILNNDDDMLPSGATKWNEIADIQDKFETYAQDNPEVVPVAP